ncbi:hypothetical protein [Rhodococcus pyridinivorans]|uniref:hypothetical protein n=1 Tax=Rhodococcus pyridinivorans TaxID=103816 RepID=UPI00265A181C|nr:hypothetical protein [Rhodococcus pyridinivorans]
MKYIPAKIPTDLSRTAVGLLWSAANIAVDEPGVDDAIAEAASRAGVYNDTVYFDVQQRAVSIAQSRVPMAPVDPTAPRNAWRTWQAAIEETWPILADAAGKHESKADRAIGLVPGRWEL